MMARRRDLQFVWPKDSEKGHRKRGFLRGLNDILSSKGPDIFLQRKGSRSAIAPDRWGNWDTYHHWPAYCAENFNSPSHPHSVIQPRGNLRYDPYSRRYVEWGHANDWFSQGLNGQGLNGPVRAVPRYTEEERARIYSSYSQGRMPNPTRMGTEWNNIGPNRWRPEHNWFWDQAHRIGCNRADGVNLTDAAFPHRWGQVSMTDLHVYSQHEF